MLCTRPDICFKVGMSVHVIYIYNVQFIASKALSSGPGVAHIIDNLEHHKIIFLCPLLVITIL